MLADEDPDILQDAVTHVSKARQTSGQSRSSTEHKAEENFEDVEIEGYYSDDEARGDEAEDEEYPQDKSV